MTRVVVAINEKGRRIGDSHHRSRISNHDVDLMRELREEHRLSYKELAEKFDVSESLVKQICNYRIRSQAPVRWKIIDVEGGE
jgi:ribosome-binding protein aMBF1 (putative translation factor)